MLNSIFILLGSICLSLALGAGTSLQWILDASSGNLDADTFSIIAHVRTPRMLTAGLCGAALAACGVYTQGLFRNPLASPSIMGNDAAAVLAGILGLALLPPLSQQFGLPLLAASGSIGVTLFMVISEKKFQKTTPQLLLIGFALSTILSGTGTLIINTYSSNPTKVQSMLQWLMGGFTNATWYTSGFLACAVILNILISNQIGRKLDVFSLGSEVAKTLGVDISALRISIAIVTGVLLGFVTAAAGPMPFVGLVIPHISRIQSGSHHPRLVFISMINGAAFLLFCDLIARTIISPIELQTGVVSTLVGAPYFFWLLMREKRYA